MLEVKKMSKSFGNNLVLNNVNANFDDGEIHGIVGRNGSGKTVLLKCLCGFLSCDQGEVVFGGKVIGRDIELPQSLGCIIETPGFVQHMSGVRNLNFLASLKGVVGPEEVRSAIAKVGLDPSDKRSVGSYSLGMRQRLALAQSIMEEPDLLVLDEPLSGIDENGAKELRALIKGLRKKGRVIVLASHSNEDIEFLCDSVHELNAGTLRRVK